MNPPKPNLQTEVLTVENTYASGHPVWVKLNGEDRSMDVVAASVAESWVDLVVRDNNGRIQIDPASPVDDPELWVKKYHGAVEAGFV